jgi:uncharacterized membrane protein YphA (DoxX/SURF4 family)
MLTPMATIAGGHDDWLPGWLGSRGVQVTIRLAICSPFIFSGINKLLGYEGAVVEVRGLVGIEPAWLLAGLVIAVQLVGSAMTLAGGALALVGAILLAGFTLAATVLAHAFWIKSGPAQVAETNVFFEHLGLIAGLLLAGWIAAARGRSRTVDSARRVI